MKRYLTICAISMALFSSCDEELRECNYTEIDPKLSLILNELIDEGKNHGVEIKIPNHFKLVFGDLDITRPGISHAKRSRRARKCGGWAEITINDRFEKREPDNLKLRLITVHELGHALFDINHVHDTSSIMHESLDMMEESFKDRPDDIYKSLFELI